MHSVDDDVRDFLLQNKSAILSFLQRATPPAVPDIMGRRSRSNSSSIERSPKPKRGSGRKSERNRSSSRERSVSRSPSPQVRVRDRRGDRNRSRSRSRSRTRSLTPVHSRRDYYDSRDSRDSGRYPSRRPFRKFDDGREAPPPSRCLGIFGMNLDTTERDLTKIFEEYGDVESVRIIRDHDTSKSRGYGFVYFERTKSAARAKDALMDAVVDGARVRVDFSVTKGPHDNGGRFRR